ncbi:MAG TPA: hypothetical protein VFU89_08585 [Rhabdochlamydiaceae bacterium]|nr:hypothetical protein [Rhabdochlamydiaceae bacterium]
MAQTVVWRSAQSILASCVTRVSLGVGLMPIALTILQNIGHAYPKNCCSKKLSDQQKLIKTSLMAASKIGQMALSLYIIHPGHPGAIIQKISVAAAHGLLCLYTHFVPRTESNHFYHRIGCGVNMALEVVVQLVNIFILGAAVFKFVHPVAVGFVVLPAALVSLTMWACNWMCDHLSSLRRDITTSF